MLTPTPRGDVTYKARAKQLRDFTGLRYGNITPTDIDGFIEYHDKCYVFYEAKYITAPPMSDGQELGFVRLCDDLQKVKPVLWIVLKHNFPVDAAIDFAVCDVEKFRYKGRWIPVKKKLKVKELTDIFFKRVAPDVP